jgi:hypothetical protein
MLLILKLKFFAGYVFVLSVAALVAFCLIMTVKVVVTCLAYARRFLLESYSEKFTLDPVLE